MRFEHSPQIWTDFPELVPGVLYVEGVTSNADVAAPVSRWLDQAGSQLAETSEGELVEVRAWRQAFSRMGLKPTQYRSAAESLLRRYRKAGSLPVIHPLVDLCNAASVAFAIPVAALDVAKVEGGLEVRYARGDEAYETFGGELEHPAVGEVVFADHAHRAHSRRWTNRQSGHSAVSDGTRAALVVVEAMHPSAAADVRELLAALGAALAGVWSVSAGPEVLSGSEPAFVFGAAGADPAVGNR